MTGPWTAPTDPPATCGEGEMTTDGWWGEGGGVFLSCLTDRRRKVAMNWGWVTGPGGAPESDSALVSVYLLRGTFSLCGTKGFNTCLGSWSYSSYFWEVFMLVLWRGNTLHLQKAVMPVFTLFCLCFPLIYFGPFLRCASFPTGSRVKAELHWHQSLFAVLTYVTRQNKKRE